MSCEAEQKPAGIAPGSTGSLELVRESDLLLERKYQQEAF